MNLISWLKELRPISELYLPNNMIISETLDCAQACLFRGKFHGWSFVPELLPSKEFDILRALNRINEKTPAQEMAGG
jgi:hypothetical protein